MHDLSQADPALLIYVLARAKGGRVRVFLVMCGIPFTPTCWGGDITPLRHFGVYLWARSLRTTTT